MPRSPVQKLAPFVRLSTNADYIDIPYTSSLSPGNGSFVLAIWYRPNDTETAQPVSHVVVQTTSASYPNGILINPYGKDLYCYLQSGPPNIAALAGVLSAGTWYRIVIVGDASAGTVKVYLNGALVAGPTSLRWNVTATNSIRIGASTDLPATAYGDVAELVFCKAGQPGFVIPTLTDVQNDYNRTATFAGRSANYPLHEGTGTSVATTIGTGSAGTLNGGALWQLSDRSPARAPQNRAIRSEEFDNAGAWNSASFGSTVTPNAFANPVDGAITADALVDNASNTSHGIQSGAVGTASVGEFWCASVYAKLARPGSVPIVLLGVSGAFGGGGTYFNLVTGARTDSLYPGEASRMEDLGGGWFRLSVFGVASVAGTNQLNIFPCATAGTTVYVGNGTASAYIFGAQMANGPAPTPYIKAVASAVGSGSVRGCVLEGENTIFQSAALANTTIWTPNPGVTCADNTADLTDPLGGTSASKIAYDGSGTAGQFLIYAYALANGGAAAALGLNDRPWTIGVWMRVASGTRQVQITNNCGTPVGTTVTVTSAWQCFTLSAVITNPAASVIVAFWLAVGDNAPLNLYVWHPQADFAKRLSTYVKTTGAAFLGPVRELAFAQQNLVTYSEQLDDVSWGLNNITASPNQIANPLDGFVTADLVAETNAAGAIHTNFLTLTGAVGGGAMTLTAYFKDNTRRWAGLRIGVAVGHEATFDLQNGTISNQINLLSATIVAVGSGWYRCRISAVMDGSGTMSVQAPFLSNTGGAYTVYNGDPTKSIYAWGVQLTVSPAAVPYVKTSSAQLGVGFAERGAVT